MEFQLIITRPRESEILIIKEFAAVSFLIMHENDMQECMVTCMSELFFSVCEHVWGGVRKTTKSSHIDIILYR